MSDPTLRIVFPADAAELRDVRHRIAAWAAPYLSASDVEDLKLAVTEACANAVQHSGTQEIRVTISLDGSCVEVVVEDDGVYQMHLSGVAGDPGAHRGLILMAAMVDDLSLQRGTEKRTGTRVRLVKCPA
ncbi:MAG: ATP-binding protein [Actinomycetota bacterium]